MHTRINVYSKSTNQLRKRIRYLARRGYIVFHKKGRAVSLNPSRSREILELVKEYE